MAKFSLKDEGAYTPAEAAKYLRISPSTLRAWVFGQKYGKSKRFLPVIQISDRKDKLLSFNNLVEIHVLSAIRKVHQIPLPKIRTGLRYVENKLGTDRPLLNQNFQTDGLDLFVEHSGLLLNVSKDGQLAIKSMVELHLKRIERDAKGLPIKLYPLIRPDSKSDERNIVIDPKIAYGKPTLIGTGVTTTNIFDRFVAGESIHELAEDFEVPLSMIEEAIRCEQTAISAA